MIRCLRLGQAIAQAKSISRFENFVGFADEADFQRQAIDGFEAALQDRARGVVPAHAIHGHPEAIGILDLFIVGVALQPAQGVKHQRLQHGVGHRSRDRSRC